MMSAEVTTPELPVLIGSTPTSEAVAVTVVDSVAYVSDWDTGLRTYDVSGDTPIQIDLDSTLGGPYQLAARDNILFVASYFAGLEIFDISNPVQPSPLGNLGLGRRVYLTLSDSYVIVAAHDSLMIVDAQNPLAPALAGSMQLPSTVRGLGFALGYVLVSYDAPGQPSQISLVDISVPSNPTIDHSLALGDRAGGIATADSVVYVGTRSRVEVLILRP